MPHDVFISYSHKDKSATDAICSILEENNIRCWIAPRDITPGAPFAEAIIDGIKDAKVFVLVYSSNSNLSQQVIKEVDRAVNHRLAIIPFRLEDVPMSKQLEYYVSDVHWLDALTPPLEQHIDKLRDVVKILLTMDEVDHADIEEAFSAGTLERFKAGIGIKRLKKLSFLVAAVFALFIAVFLAIRFFDRQSEIRWAREVALPEIRKLIGENDAWRNLVAPYRLAEQAEAILGDDPELAALFSQVSLDIDVLTEPPGANVYMKEYVDNASEWTFLGVTPLEKIRVPIGIFRWKMDKEGYDEVLAAESTWSVETSGKIIVPNLIKRTLDQPGTAPPGMVRVPKTETMAGHPG